MIYHSCFVPAVIKQIDMHIYCTSPTNKYLNLPSPKNTKDTFFRHHRYREKDSRNSTFAPSDQDMKSFCSYTLQLNDFGWNTHMGRLAQSLHQLYFAYALLKNCIETRNKQHQERIKSELGSSQLSKGRKESSSFHLNTC